MPCIVLLFGKVNVRENFKAKSIGEGMKGEGS